MLCYMKVTHKALTLEWVTFVFRCKLAKPTGITRRKALHQTKCSSHHLLSEGAPTQGALYKLNSTIKGLLWESFSIAKE